MIIHRSAKMIETLLVSAYQKITSPKSLKDTIYGTARPRGAFLPLFAYEQLLVAEIFY